MDESAKAQRGTQIKVVKTHLGLQTYLAGIVILTVISLKGLRSVTAFLRVIGKVNLQVYLQGRSWFV